MEKEFKKYQHLERFGTSEVEGIELGTCHIFPKLDGTNASLWVSEGVLCAGSRNRQLSLDSDNAGFYNWAIKQENIINFFKDFPEARLYGEWLVPHSLKTYRDSAWRNFYVFDVVFEDEYRMPYQYEPVLDRYGIKYIKATHVVKNPSYEMLISYAKSNTFLIQDGKGAGEGIVIKNYAFKNKYGRQIWAKIVLNEFKEIHRKEMGSSEHENKLIEELISEKYVTKSLCEKVKSKIENEKGDWQSKYIPQLLNTVYYDLIREDSWNFTKEFKNPTINFKTLQHFVFNKTKEHLDI